MKEHFKKSIAIVLALLCLVMCPLVVSAKEAEAEENIAPLPIETEAKAVLLGDVDSGKILTGSNIHEKVYPASVTKIMTLLLAMEALESGKIHLDDVVTASATAAGKGGSQIWLKEGEQMTVQDLLKATTVASANDASTALAETIAGSESAFCDRMNEKAQNLGMLDTHFENCTGLDDDTKNHVTSAYDVFLMSRALLSHEKILEYSTIWMDSLRGGETSLVNTNKLVHSYTGVTGLKTGTTSKAGCCVSASAKREETHFVAVVMGSPNSKSRFQTAKALLDWGFSNFETVSISVPEASLAPIQVLQGKENEIRIEAPKPVRLLLPKGQKEKIQTEVLLPVDVAAPLEEGQILGKVHFLLDEHVLESVSLKSPRKILKISFADAFYRILCTLCG